MECITKPPAFHADDQAPAGQAGVHSSATSSPLSFTSINTSACAKTSIGTVPLEPERPNKKQKTTITLNEKHNGPDTVLSPEPLEQMDAITATSCPGTRSTTTLAPCTSDLKRKCKPNTGKRSKGKVVKGVPSLRFKSLESTAVETGLAVATEEGITTEVHDSATEAEQQLFEHAQGWHEGRDPYGLASQPYLWRGEPVPWWVCGMCKEEGERMSGGGTWPSQG